jgi:hypothetical protein
MIAHHNSEVSPASSTSVGQFQFADIAQRMTRARAARAARAASVRRRIDPTTCERDYSQDEIEFMKAMQEYKERSGRMFPTCGEVLEVLQKLGYSKPRSPQSV